MAWPSSMKKRRRTVFGGGRFMPTLCYTRAHTHAGALKRPPPRHDTHFLRSAGPVLRRLQSALGHLIFNEIVPAGRARTSLTVGGNLRTTAQFGEGEAATATGGGASLHQERRVPPCGDNLPAM